MLYPDYLKKRGGLLPRVVLGVVVVALLVGVGFFIWTKKNVTPVAVNTAPTANVNTNTNVGNATENWWTYTSPDLQFRLRYPRTLVADTQDDGVYFQDVKKTTAAAIVFQTRDTDEQLTTWHSTQAVSQEKLGGVNAKKFVYQACGQLGGAQTCGPQTVAVVVERPGNFLALEFYGDNTLDATEQAIVDSFTFLDINLVD